MPTITVTDATFDQLVLKSELPVLVDFWASWCGPCKALAPTLEQVSEDWEGRITLAKLDIEANPDITQDYQIKSIPTLIMFQNGEATFATQGVLNKDGFASFFKQCGLT